MAWTACPPAPLAWIELREVLLTILNTPLLLLPLLTVLALALLWRLPLRRRSVVVLSAVLPLLASLLYSPATTALLERWLASQVPSPSPLVSASPVAVAVLPGRGPQIAAVTTPLAAASLRRGTVSAIYVSGDQRATAEQLLRLGAPPALVSGDSCARTTWENATRTASWLRRHHPGAPVLLITDPWQLPRASHAFLRQGLSVVPQPAIPPLSPAQQNRLALREAAATVLYDIQGRM
jgi:uncharacterized SAM-binding protein YcdF (DUF218 family)